MTQSIFRGPLDKLNPDDDLRLSPLQLAHQSAVTPPPKREVSASGRFTNRHFAVRNGFSLSSSAPGLAVADEQGIDAVRRTVTIASDDELLLALQLQFDPVTGALPGLIQGVLSFGDHSLETHLANSLQDILRGPTQLLKQSKIEASWRVSPADPVPVVLTLNAERIGRMMRWDLVPYRSHGVPTGKVLINAKAEHLESNYYWGRVAGGASSRWRDSTSRTSSRTGRREPYYVHLADREVFGVAGLRERSKREDGTELHSCTLITIPPNELMAQVHNEELRIPAVLREEDHEAWLNGTPAEAGRKVNNVKGPNDASLIEPVPTQAR